MILTRSLDLHSLAYNECLDCIVVANDGIDTTTVYY